MSLAPPAVPCSKCGWFHRRTPEQVWAEREAARAARRQERRRKQTYAVRRKEFGYRFSMFKAQAARRGKTVELQRHDYARILRQPCLYCGSTERIGVDRAQNDGHYTRANSVPCCATCNYMKGSMRIGVFAEHARRVGVKLGALARSKSMP